MSCSVRLLTYVRVEDLTLYGFCRSVEGLDSVRCLTYGGRIFLLYGVRYTVGRFDTVRFLMYGKRILTCTVFGVRRENFSLRGVRRNGKRISLCTAFAVRRKYLVLRVTGGSERDPRRMNTMGMLRGGDAGVNVIVFWEVGCGRACSSEEPKTRMGEEIMYCLSALFMSYFYVIIARVRNLRAYRSFGIHTKYTISP